MCRLACEQMSSWLMVDDWEASQSEYQRTAIVLEHFDKQINEVLGGVPDQDGTIFFRLLSRFRFLTLPTN
jgi:nicotinamide mononucleotide adenylyltransferase